MKFKSIVKSFYHHFFWLAPFAAFIIGYFACSSFFYPRHITMPSLIGLPIQDALVILSNNNLNARILSEQEDNDLPAGIVLMQTPSFSQKIKAGQSVFLVLSKKSKVAPMPQLLQKSTEEITKILNQEQITAKQYLVECESIAGLCIAQYPKPMDSSKKTNIIYISSGQSSIFLLPSLKGISIPCAVEFLKKYHIPYSIIHTDNHINNHECITCSVIDQRPLRWTLIDLKKPITVQLYAKKV